MSKDEELEHLRGRVKELSKALLITLNDTWPYLHRWCTINSIFKRRKKAENALHGGKYE
jgi:hypothetical protein